MPTYVKIAEATGSASQYTFSSIPQTYQDLVILGSSQSSTGGDTDIILIRLNGDSATNYRNMGIATSGSSTTRTVIYSESSFLRAATQGTAQGAAIFAPQYLYFFDYTNTARKKTFLQRSGYFIPNSSVGGVQVLGGHWQSTSAITSISLSLNSTSNFTAASRFTLYGIAS